MERERIRWIPILLLLLFFGLVFTGITRESLWRDEVDSIRFAADIWQQLDSGVSWGERGRALVGYLTQPGWNGPLYFVTLEPWLQLAGRSELALRFPSTLAAVLAVALSYPLATRLLGRRAGRILVLLMATNPYLVWYAGEGKMYAALTALALAATYLLVKALSCGRWWLWLAYVLTMTTLFYSHILSPLLLPVHLALALLQDRRQLWKPGPILAAAALTLPYLPLLIWQWPHIAQPAETGFAFVPLSTMVWRQMQVFSQGVTGWPAGIAVGLFAATAGLGLLTGPWQSKASGRRAALSLFFWLVLPLLELYLISLRRPLFTERYLIWILPAWLGLATAGLAWLAGGRGWRRVLAAGWLAALVVVGTLGIVRQWQTPVRGDMRGATALVAEHYRPDDLILFQIPYYRYSFEYYAPDLEVQSADGPYTNAGATKEEADLYLESALAGRERVWLILAEENMWDVNGYTLAWFQEQGELLQTAEFNRVRVYLWGLP